MEKEYDLVPILEKETQTFLIQKFDEVKGACEYFISENLEKVNLEVFNKETYGDVKKIRTAIRKKQDQVKEVRLSCNEIAMGTFNEQAKTLESMLKEADEKLKAYVDAYDRDIEGELPKPAKITLTIKGYDLKKVEKVKEYAIKQGLEAAIK